MLGLGNSLNINAWCSSTRAPGPEVIKGLFLENFILDRLPNLRPRNIAAEQTNEIENWKRDVMLEIFTMRRNLTNLENQVRNHPF